MDIGLDHTELVDTCTQDRVYILYGCVHLRAQLFLDRLVCCIETEDVVHLFGAKQRRIAHPRPFRIGRFELYKEVVEITLLAVSLSSISCFERLKEYRVRASVGERTQDLFDRDFKDHIHSTSQVQAEIDLFFFDFRIGELIDEDIVHIFCRHTVEIGFLFDRIAIGHLSCIAFHTTGDPGEGQLIETGQRE